MTLQEIPIQLERRRKKVGMTKRAVSVRSTVSLPTVNRILSGREKRLTLGNVESIAKALGVTVRLGATTGLEEVDNAFEFREKQATAKATQLVQMVQATMGLEAQAIDAAAIDQMIKQTVCELLAGSPRRLWDE